MIDPSGTLPPQPSQNPRRPPAHQSVSLRHNRPIAHDSKPAFYHHPQLASPTSLTAPASDKAKPPSTASAKIISHDLSLGESSDAGKWFENTNNNAVQSNTSFVDNDPPFFLRNSSSSETPPDGHEPRSAHLRPQSTTMPYRPDLTHFDTDRSSTEDFRSVIDDLTVANKRLKQKLRKYEKLYDAHLQDEKLFEVRFHGLPDHNKRELEETLRKFASDLSERPNSGQPPNSYAPQLHPQKTASSFTSRFAESGYASMSASGQNSISAPLSQESDIRRMSTSQYNRQQESIHSFLHDIPAGLLPKRNAPMSDKSKKKLVVRRLEQIFAGKRSASESHPQPMQQEEVAQSAAMADRRAKEATGQQSKQEGLREARIMTGQSEEEDITALCSPEVLQKLPPALFVGEQDFASSGSPDQRPTRPLDLDLYRAQVPADNMQYIRHLGFTPPDMASGEAPEDGHGWLYLNLLINMAQLHTINVTPDFVKEAVSEYSSKFELSHDGRKIRWKGGDDSTIVSSDSSSEYLGGNSPYRALSGSNLKSPAKRFKTSHSGGNSASTLNPERQARRATRAPKEKHRNKFAYTPLFFHNDDSEEDEDFYNYDMSTSYNSPALLQHRGNSSGFASSTTMRNSSQNRHDDGPIIFYNNAKFCTDLSGDRRGLSVTNPAAYKTIKTEPLGAITKAQDSLQHTSRVGELRGSFNTTPMDFDLKEGEQTSSSEEEIVFFPEALRDDNGTESPEIMDFEASGLGGVQPDDNFAIKVRRSHIQTASSTSAASTRRKSHLYAQKILEALTEQPSSEGGPIIREEILSASRKSLPSSTLPPASFLPFDSTSSDDVDSDLESDISSGPSASGSSDHEEEDPHTTFELLNITPTHADDATSGSESESAEAEAGSDSDDSVDLLATARQLDPKTVRASEREYDAAVADRLVEEILAGNSAATAGGGSGFNTPGGVAVIAEDGEGTRRPSITSESGASKGKSGLKRARTSDSLATTLQHEKLQKSRKMSKETDVRMNEYTKA